jgi:hypothetical protein
MPNIQISDRNGNPVSIDSNGVGANVAATQVIADQSGNKFTLAPGLIALPVSTDLIKAAYCYAGTAFAPVATPTDIIQIQGSGTKTVRIKRIKLSGGATAAGNMPALLFRRSAADSGSAVLTPVTAGKLDTTDASSTAVVSTIGTANATSLGAQVGGQLRSGRVQMPAIGSGIGVAELVWEFGRVTKACVLRGTSDFICINLNGAAIPSGGVIDFEILTEEDLS